MILGLHSHAMTENNYIAQLETRWPRREDSDAVLLVTIALADEAVRAFPQSPRLWCIRGDVIQLGPESCPHSLEDARACYQRATEIDPQFIEAWESLGHFHNAVLDDETTAQRFFSQAERLKGHHVA
jgi:tetratricopeptide (TPR) repeat protein